VCTRRKSEERRPEGGRGGGRHLCFMSGFMARTKARIVWANPLARRPSSIFSVTSPPK